MYYRNEKFQIKIAFKFVDKSIVYFIDILTITKFLKILWQTQ